MPIINDLMDIFNGLGFSPIQLPMICVRALPPLTTHSCIHPSVSAHSSLFQTVGGQSAGKSSVLEAVVRKDFLPRNS